ncbi:hypothetical protein NST99_02600 [Paenibacillus sp. FSL L8-0470]|uniref:hypothetical protein n=1 Tax=unclassified Paenibacillus TaxID=185978 RepID=UPI0030F6CC32
MPDPLSPEWTAASEFAEYVQKNTGNIYALTSLLLGEGAVAEKTAMKTFTELYTRYLHDDFIPQPFSLVAYRECIQQCSRAAEECSLFVSNGLAWEDQIVQVLWYGMLLPLPAISTILEQSVPVLKTRLRHVREQMCRLETLRPEANLFVV